MESKKTTRYWVMVGKRAVSFDIAAPETSDTEFVRIDAVRGGGVTCTGVMYNKGKPAQLVIDRVGRRGFRGKALAIVTGVHYRVSGDAVKTFDPLRGKNTDGVEPVAVEGATQ